jgi:hypothetical protein
VNLAAHTRILKEFRAELQRLSLVKKTHTQLSASIIDIKMGKRKALSKEFLPFSL